MLTQLTTIKSRLALTIPDYDDLLTAALASCGTYEKFSKSDLLPSVTTTLKHHTRFANMIPHDTESQNC